MKHDIIVRNIKKIALFDSIDENEMDRFASVCRPVDVKAGSILMREGDVGSSMFLFSSGIVDVTKNLTLKSGKQGFSSAEKSMVKLDANHAPFFGDMAMFENDVRSATITAFTDCLLYEIQRSDFEAYCHENPVMGYKLISRIAVILCERVRKGNQDVLKLTTALSIALSRGSIK
ncbi:MAG: cyclic nucleotide-binding domain-containing protein [Spirochaetaceae bacterium]|nr:MAG: cyclic nucleotide-binding domain-containing protein [Spirochaetaceae bacterium]